MRLGAIVERGPTEPFGGERRSFDGHGRERFVGAPVAGVMRRPREARRWT